MTTLSSRFLAALAFALVAGGVTSVQAVTIASEAAPDITIYKPLGFAFGYTTGTPSNLFGGFGGGGSGGGSGGFASGGMVPPLNFGVQGGNSLVAPNGGSGSGGGGGGSTANGGGGGGSTANGGGISQGNVGPEGGNFLAGPSGGGGGGGGGSSFGGTSSGPVTVFQSAAPNVQGESSAPFVLMPQNGESAVSVPDTGIGALGFGFVLALFALLSPLTLRATVGVRTN